MFLADLLYNSRRTHFTRRQFRAVLEFARQCEGSTVPSFAALKKFQASLKSRLGNPTKRVVSSGGTVYYVNQVSESLRQVCQRFYIINYRREEANEYVIGYARTWPIQTFGST